MAKSPYVADCSFQLQKTRIRGAEDKNRCFEAAKARFERFSGRICDLVKNYALKPSVSKNKVKNMTDKSRKAI
jgi:hypothetical protein